MATDLIYVFPQDGPFKNMRVRARYGQVWENGASLVGTKVTNDIRLDMGLNIPF